MEGGIGEALALILIEEFAVVKFDVVDLVARATPIRPLPLRLRFSSLSDLKNKELTYKGDFSKSKLEIKRHKSHTHLGSQTTFICC